MPAPMLEKAAQGALDTFYRMGFNGIIEQVPEPEREKVLGFAMPMSQLTLTDLRDVMRERYGLQASKDRQSVVKGKSVTGQVDLGGRRVTQKNKNTMKKDRK